MKFFPKKILVLLISVTMLLTFTVSGTVAYLMDGTGSVQNVFTPGSVTPVIDETTSDNAKTSVMVTNTGEVDAYIRVMVVVTWQDGQGNVYPQTPAEETDYTITYNSADWTYGAGGYWYYNSRVASGDKTKSLITHCTPHDTEPTGYTLHVEILAQAIQADGWPAGVTGAQAAFAEAAKSN